MRPGYAATAHSSGRVALSRMQIHCQGNDYRLVWLIIFRGRS